MKLKLLKHADLIILILHRALPLVVLNLWTIACVRRRLITVPSNDNIIITMLIVLKILIFFNISKVVLTSVMNMLKHAMA